MKGENRGSLGQTLAIEEREEEARREKARAPIRAKIETDAARGRAYVQEQEQIRLKMARERQQQAVIDERKMSPGFSGVFFRAAYGLGDLLQRLG